MGTKNLPMPDTLLKKLNREGYTRCRRLPTGEIAGILPQIYTVGLCVGLNEIGYRTRFCYEHRNDALAALESWDGRRDPPGPWIKQKPEDRLNPAIKT